MPEIRLIIYAGQNLLKFISTLYMKCETIVNFFVNSYISIKNIISKMNKKLKVLDFVL